MSIFEALRNIDIDIDENAILKTIDKLCHLKDVDDNTIPSYCFLHEITDTFNISKEKAIEIAYANGYTIIEVLPNDEIDGTLLIADKDCSIEQIQDDYTKFFGVEIEAQEFNKNKVEIKTESLKETLNPATGSKITDARILSLLKDCVKDVASIYSNYSSNLQTELDYIENESSKTFGTMCYPKYEGDSFKLVLNKHMYSEPDDAIKNTIYHELAHFIQMLEQFDNDVVYWSDSDGSLLASTKYRSEYWKSHGTRWRQIADEIGRKFNTEIHSTDSFTLHTGVGDYAQDKRKWVVKCKHCGHESRYERVTDFVKNPNISTYDALVKKYGETKVKQRYSDSSIERFKKLPYWSCGLCGAKGEFESNYEKQ